MAENTEIMDKLKDNGLSEEVNKRIADVYNKVHQGTLKNTLTYSEVIDLFEGIDYDLEISERIYDELEKLLNHLIQKKSLREYGMKKSEIEEFTDSVIENQQRLLKNNFVYLDRDALLDIYTKLY